MGHSDVKDSLRVEFHCDSKLFCSLPATHRWKEEAHRLCISKSQAGRAWQPACLPRVRNRRITKCSHSQSLHSLQLESYAGSCLPTGLNPSALDSQFIESAVSRTTVPITFTPPFTHWFILSTSLFKTTMR